MASQWIIRMLSILVHGGISVRNFPALLLQYRAKVWTVVWDFRNVRGVRTLVALTLELPQHGSRRRGAFGLWEKPLSGTMMDKRIWQATDGRKINFLVGLHTQI
jgi:hypothetical protein